MTATEATGQLAIRRWLEPPINGPGVDPRSTYVDHYWTPTVGAMATGTARLLMRMIGQDLGRVELTYADVATCLGLIGADPRQEIETALARLTVAGIATRDDDGTVLIRSELPYLDQAQVDHLPAPLRIAHGAAFSLRAEAGPGPGPAAMAPNARLLSLAATIDEILTNLDLTPRQLAYRWQHVVRLAEESRDESVLDWADPELETTLAEGQLSAQTMSEAVWATQHALASRGQLPDACRSYLCDAAAGVIDWLVAEFPTTSEAWVLDHPDL
ncbi:hypothetical protein BH10ACT1_BH10ACT1_36460 [soil metagenome]